MSIEYEFLNSYGNFEEVDYLDLMHHILDNGLSKDDRTGVGVRSIFHATLNFDLSNYNMPLLTTKKVAWKSIVSELLWFLEGSTDERRLAEIHYGKSREELKDKTTIWTANANNQGVALGYENNEMTKELGPVYGKQWRDFGGVDQIKNLIEGLKKDPNGRRHILNAWNVGQLKDMALPPCHMFAQFYVENEKYLSLCLYQRSCDMFLGVPFNIASYSLLAHIIAKESGLYATRLYWVGGDCHIYNNHVDAVKTQLSRHPKIFPKLYITDGKNIDNYSVDDFQLKGYNPFDAIPAPMAI